MCSTHKLKSGKGSLNNLINKLPFEVHVPGYQFCAPGTKLKERLARGDKGVNPLDSACRTHDNAYENSNNLDIRHKADKLLEDQAIISSEKKNKKKRKNDKRIILTPNQLGGALPLASIFAGLSALGSIASGASSLYNVVKNRKKSNGLYLNNPISKGLIV
jgi:hypothetical protein